MDDQAAPAGVLAYEEHGIIFWAALDQLGLSEDADTLQGLSNKLKGRVGKTREYTNTLPKVGATYWEKDDAEDRAPRLRRLTHLYPRLFDWKVSFYVDLNDDEGELLKKGLKALKTAKQRGPDGKPTDVPIITAQDAAEYYECLGMADAWMKGADVDLLGADAKVEE